MYRAFSPSRAASGIVMRAKRFFCSPSRESVMADDTLMGHGRWREKIKLFEKIVSHTLMLYRMIVAAIVALTHVNYFFLR